MSMPSSSEGKFSQKVFHQWTTNRCNISFVICLIQISRNFFLEPTKEVGARTRLVITPDQPVHLKFHDRT